jgi:hypothetical protein
VLPPSWGLKVTQGVTFQKTVMSRAFIRQRVFGRTFELKMEEVPEE